MNFNPSRAEALNHLNNFIENNLSEYSKLRNFDFGPTNRSNISCLSPYITHGVINELEVIEQSLKKFSFSKIEKFIQEVLWRVYWKGWLELRPNVWSDYFVELKKIKNNYKENKTYLNAIDGKTNIDCFNQWVIELKENNYLHNHARMWFASIWIFTLDLPWQLGAEFFMKHLYDGDSASNTLGWRWVAGIQTQGKHYLAKEWNIKKFTNNRFENINLNENAPPIASNKNYTQINPDFINSKITNDKTLIIFDNQLCFEHSDFKNHSFKKIMLIQNKNLTRTVELNKIVIEFKQRLIEDQQHRLQNDFNIEIRDISYLKNLDLSDKVGLYPGVGENLDYCLHNQINLPFLYRRLDQITHPYCQKGFFNFKNYIPKIITLIK